MKLIEPSYKILPQASGLEGVYKQIELAGRTCYRSQEKIIEDSAKGFVDRMIKSGHGATLEHGTVYLKFETVKTARHPLDKYYYNKYSRVKTEEGLTKLTKIVFVTTNLRVLVENNWLDDLKYLCEPTEYHEKRITVKFICSRSISHELVRHRVFSFCQESQRYCNYSKDKFGKEVTFIDPLYSDYDKKLITTEAFDNVYEILVSALEEAEGYYFMLLDEGFKAEEAREVLPNATKTEIVMTGFESDWIRFFNLRCDKAAHPEMRRLAIPLRKEIINLPE